MKKRILSLVLCLCMVLSLLPATALAAEGDPAVTICGTTLESGKFYTANGTDAVTTLEDAPTGQPYLEYTADATTGTLTAHGDVEIANSAKPGISVTGAVTINTGSEGDSLTVTNSSSGASSLSLYDAAVTFTGSGNLTLAGTFTPVYYYDGVNQLLTSNFAGNITISNTDENGSDSDKAIELPYPGSSVQLETTGALKLSTESAATVVAVGGSVTLKGDTVLLTNDGTHRLIEAGEISITSTSETADLSLTGTCGYPLLSATKNDTTGNITLSSGGDLTVQNDSTTDGSAIGAGGRVSATAAGALTIASASSTDTIYAGAGSIALAGNAVSLTNSGTGTLATAYGGNISITSTSDTEALTLTSSPSSCLFYAGSGSGTVTLSCGGDLTVNNEDGSNSSKLIYGGLTVEKAKNVNISGACANTVISGDLNISDVTGNVTIDANVAGYQIGGNANITATGDVTLINSYDTSSSPVIQGIATITSTTGSIDIEGAAPASGYVIAGNGADTGSVTATFTAAKRIVALNLSPDNTDVTKQSNLCPLTDDCYTIWTMSAEDAGTLAWQYRYGGKALDTSGIDIPQEGTTPTCNTAYAAGDGWVLWRPTVVEGVVTGGTVELEDATIPYALVLPANVTLELTGTNTVNGPISAAGDLTVVGPGSLNIVTDKLAGISATGSVTVESGTVDVNMDTAETNARGIYSQTSVTVNGGAVTVELQSSAANAYGVMAGTGVAVSGGTFDVTAKSTAAEGAILSGGLFTMGPTTFSGGNVTVSADSFAVCSMGAITLASGMRETGGKVVCSGTIEDTGTAPVYTFAAEGATFASNDEMKTVAAKSITLNQRGTLSVVTMDADAHYDAGDTITAKVVVSALEDASAKVNSAEFTLNYDTANLTLVGITPADGWTTEDVNGATRMIETASTGISVPEGGLVIAAATFTVNAGAADNTSTAITVTDPELKITGENNGFVPAVVPAPVTLHNIVVTLQQPEAGATLTGSTTAYAKYGVKGLYSDTGRTEKFTMPTVTATTGYRLAKGTADEPLWKVSGGTATYTDNAAVLAETFSTSTTLNIQVVKTYTVTITPPAGGTLDPDVSPLTVDTGSALLKQLPKATADGNHDFGDWCIKAAEGGTDTLVNETTTVTGDITVEALFTSKLYTLTVETSEHVTVNTSGATAAGQIAYGNDVSLAPMLDDGYVIDTVTYKVGDAGTEVTITPNEDGYYIIPGDKITGNITATVTAVQRCTITFANVTGATLSETPTYYGKVGKTGLYADEACTIVAQSLPTVSYNSGTGYQYRATADNVAEPGWKIGETSVTSTALLNQQTFIADATVTPNAVKQYLVTYAVDDAAHATVTVGGNSTAWFDEGALLSTQAPTVSYTPGYVLDHWTVGETSYTDWTQAGAATVGSALTVTLHTKVGTYGVTFPTIDGVTFTDQTGLTENTATFGTAVSFKMTVAAGYVVNSVSYKVGTNGTETELTAGENGVYTIPGDAITDAVTVLVTSTQLNTVQFVTGTDAHGTLSGTTVFYLADGVSLTAAQLTTVTVTPDTGYVFKYWTVGDIQTDPLTYAVNNNVTFTAVFALADYTVTVPAGMTATVGSNNYTAGETVTVHYNTDIVLTPNSDSTIVAVSCQVGGGAAQTVTRENGAYTIPGAAVTGNLTVTAATLADKGLTLSYISAEQYKALMTETKIAVLTPDAGNESAATITKITMTDGTSFYWSARYGAFVKIVSTTETAASLCGGLTFFSDGEKNTIAYTGDITGDGKITASDAAVANEILHNPTRGNTTELMRLKCDVTDNDTTGTKIVTSDDILWILAKENASN